MNTFTVGWVSAFVFWILLVHFGTKPIAKERGRTEIRDQAVEKGYGEYVIEEKKIVFKWKETSK